LELKGFFLLNKNRSESVLLPPPPPQQQQLLQQQGGLFQKHRLCTDGNRCLHGLTSHTTTTIVGIVVLLNSTSYLYYKKNSHYLCSSITFSPWSRRGALPASSPAPPAASSINVHRWLKRGNQRFKIDLFQTWLKRTCFSR